MKIEFIATYNSNYEKLLHVYLTDGLNIKLGLETLELSVIDI